MSGYPLVGQPPVIPYLRPQPASGEWLLPVTVATTTAAAPSVSARVHAWPFVFERPTPLILMRIYCTIVQAGAACRLGLYNEISGRPGALLLDVGEIDLSSGTGDKDSSAFALTVSGVVWALTWMKNVATQATLHTVSVGNSSWISQKDDLFSFGKNYNYGLAAAYPASMPATAPAVVANSALSNAPVPALKGA